MATKRKPRKLPKPTIIIIAGPNGAGKTTFANQHLPAEFRIPNFINADLIARGLAPFAPESASIQAGKIMLEQIDRHVAAQESFAIETTLAGRNYSRRIPGWRRVGYTVNLVFLGLSSADLAVARVKNRVKHGGHDIPESVIRRRFEAGLRNFHELYCPIVDEWLLYLNDHRLPRLIAKGANHA